MYEIWYKTEEGTRYYLEEDELEIARAIWDRISNYPNRTMLSQRP